MDERGLVSHVLHGDLDAYETIVRRHQQTVFNTAWRLLGNLHDAEDAAQETFIRAFQFLDKYDPDRPLAPWLKKIAVRVCLDSLAGRRRLPILETDHELLPAPDPGPETQTLDRQRDERVRAELLGLPSRYRAVIELRHFQGLDYAEIARVLKRPLSTVKSDLFRSRKMLAERLKDLK